MSIFDCQKRVENVAELVPLPLFSELLFRKSPLPPLILVYGGQQTRIGAHSYFGSENQFCTMLSHGELQLSPVPMWRTDSDGTIQLCESILLLRKPITIAFKDI